jgi:hypothetical protein
MSKYVLITGVSSGIGKALAQKLLENTDYIILGTVRKQVDAEELKKKYPDRFQSYICELSDLNSINSLEKSISNFLGANQLYAIINNAGVLYTGSVIELPISKFEDSFKINVISPLYLIQKLFPKLQKNNADHPSKIINISSLSGTRTFPFLSAYAMSKHSMESLSDALRRELAPFSIKVVSLLPGSIQTEMIEKINTGLDEQIKSSIYKTPLLKFKELNDKKVKSGVPLNKVVSTIIQALESKNPKARYFLRTSFLIDYLLPKVLPTSVFDKLISKSIQLEKRKIHFHEN